MFVVVFRGRAAFADGLATVAGPEGTGWSRRRH
jgi:hypothetical protein